LDLQDAIHVVGMTCDGLVPLLRIGSRSGETIVLPGVTLIHDDAAAEGEGLDSVNRMLSALGYRATELITMSRYGIPTGDVGCSSVLLAPLLARDDRPRRGVAAVRLAIDEIPIAGAEDWLRERRSAGARVDPKVWVGLRLAERHFPLWASQRLRASLRELQRRGFSRGLAGDVRASNAEAGARGA
jgi:hypothetical protein